MKKIFLFILPLLIASRLGYCDTPSLQVRLTALSPEIFVGQVIGATVEVVNSGTLDVQLPSPKCSLFHDLLGIDNPHLGFAGGVELTCSDVVSVKPGARIDRKVYLEGSVHGLGPIIFRLSFKPTTSATPVWSNPVTITFKGDSTLSVKVEASLKSDDVSIADPSNPEALSAHVKITNISNVPQDIGVDGECGLHELMDLISDQKSISVISGEGSCLASNGGPSEVILKPNEVYVQDCHISYVGKEPNPKPITFRIGIKNVGYKPVWSNALTAIISGGTIQRGKHQE